MAVHILIPDPPITDSLNELGNGSTPSYNASTPASTPSLAPNFTMTPHTGDNTSLGPTDEPAEPLPVCLWILYAQIGQSDIRVWDLMLLVPNVVFLLFMLVRSQAAVAKLRQMNRPIFFTFYIMAFVATIVSVVRAVVSMIVDVSTEEGDLADTLLWVAVRFALLAIELCVVIFGVGFSHLDSTSSIKLILLITCIISFCYSVVQCSLEILFPHTPYEAPNEYDLFTHGGMIFWCATSAVFCFAYVIVFCLPYTPVKDKLQLPAKKSFYCYIAALALLYFCQAIASGLVYDEMQQAICVADITSFLYFTCFAPLIYITFLHNFFRASKQQLLLSYATQPDEHDDESHHLPYAISHDHTFSSSLYDSTEFGQGGTPPPISGQLTFSINAAQVEPLSPPLSSPLAPPPPLLAPHEITEISDTKG